jgi:hypothetical protein
MSWRKQCIGEQWRIFHKNPDRRRGYYGRFVSTRGEGARLLMHVYVFNFPSLQEVGEYKFWLGQQIFKTVTNPQNYQAKLTLMMDTNSYLENRKQLVFVRSYMGQLQINQDSASN